MITRTKKRFLLVFFAVAACLCFAVAAGCKKDTDKPNSSAKIKISSTVTDVLEGDTLTLRAVVTGTTQKDLSWSCDNPAIATVGAKTGVCTGIAPGKATVTVSLDAEPTVKDSVEINVAAAVVPTSVGINGETQRMGWVGETDAIAVTVAPENGSKAFSWQSSDEAVATVENGTVSFRTEGSVTITVNSQKNPALSATVTYEVKKGVFFTNKAGYAKNIDYSHQADAENAYIITDGVEEIAGGNAHAVAWFNIPAGRRYYAEATIGMIGNGTSDSWTRAGLGNGTSDNDIRAFFLGNKDGHKTFMMNNNNVWGAETARTWVYGVDGRRSLNVESYTMGMLRDENKYYFTINGKLYWYEETTMFGSVDTLPCFVSKDIQARVTGFSVTADETVIAEKLQSAEYGRKMFNCGTNDGDIEVFDDYNFDFKNANQTFNDMRVECLGEKGYLSGNFTVEYYVSNFNADAADSALSVFLRRYESDNPIISDTISLNYTNINVRTLSYGDKNMAAVLNGFNKNAETFASPLTSSSTAYVKIERTVNGGSSSFKIYVDGQIQKFGENDSLTVNYSGPYLIYMGSTHATARVKSFAFGATDGFTPAPDPLATEKTAAAAEIAGYKSANDYRENERAALATLVTKYTVKVKVCDSAPQISAWVAEFKTEADKLTTDAEYAEQEAQISQVKTAAKQQVSSYKQAGDYRAEEQAALEALISAAHSQIDGLVSASDIANVVAEFKTEADKLTTAAQHEWNEAILFDTAAGGYANRIDYTNGVDLSGGNAAYIQTKSGYGGDDDGSYAVAMFKASGKKYYAEATVKYVGNLSGNGWARFGIGNATAASDGNARVFYLSPQQKATVMMDIPNGWGAECGASMIWNVNGISDLNFAGGLKLAVLRDGNTYYYLINDALYWVDKTEKFNNTDTHPVIASTALIMQASAYSVTTDETVINAKLASAEYKKQFFNASLNGFAAAASDGYAFAGTDGSAYYQNNCVRAYGDAATYSGSFYVDFTLSDVAGSAADFNQKIGLGLRRVDDDAKVDSVMFGAGGSADIRCGWSWNGGHTFWQAQDDGNGCKTDLASSNGSYRVEVTASGSGKTITLYSVEGATKTQLLTRTVNFTGAYIVTLGANLCSGKITNISAGEL